MTPAGSAPVCVKTGAGAPVAVTVNVPALPVVKVVALALVITGAAPPLTVSVKDWTAGTSTPLLALKVRL